MKIESVISKYLLSNYNILQASKIESDDEYEYFLEIYSAS
jgi:hypothetical protein